MREGRPSCGVPQLQFRFVNVAPSPPKRSADLAEDRNRDQPCLSISFLGQREALREGQKFSFGASLLDTPGPDVA